jgi:hypothetical protein
MRPWEETADAGSSPLKVIDSLTVTFLTRTKTRNYLREAPSEPCTQLHNQLSLFRFEKRKER